MLTSLENSRENISYHEIILAMYSFSCYDRVVHQIIRRIEIQANNTIE